MNSRVLQCLVAGFVVFVSVCECAALSDTTTLPSISTHEQSTVVLVVGEPDLVFSFIQCLSNESNTIYMDFPPDKTVNIDRSKAATAYNAKLLFIHQYNDTLQSLIDNTTAAINLLGKNAGSIDSMAFVFADVEDECQKDEIELEMALEVIELTEEMLMFGGEFNQTLKILKSLLPRDPKGNSKLVAYDRSCSPTNVLEIESLVADKISFVLDNLFDTFFMESSSDDIETELENIFSELLPVQTQTDYLMNYRLLYQGDIVGLMHTLGQKIEDIQTVLSDASSADDIPSILGTVDNLFNILDMELNDTMRSELEHTVFSLQHSTNFTTVFLNACLQPFENLLTEMMNTFNWYRFIFNIHNRLVKYDVQSTEIDTEMLTQKIMSSNGVTGEEIVKILDPYLPSALSLTDVSGYEDIAAMVVDEMILENLKFSVVTALANEVKFSAMGEEKLRVTGGIVKLSNVVDYMLNEAITVHEIEIFATECIFIDADFEKHVHLSLVAPTWIVVGTRKISLGEEQLFGVALYYNNMTDLRIESSSTHPQVIDATCKPELCSETQTGLTDCPDIKLPCEPPLKYIKKDDSDALSKFYHVSVYETVTTENAANVSNVLLWDPPNNSMASIQSMVVDGRNADGVQLRTKCVAKRHVGKLSRAVFWNYECNVKTDAATEIEDIGRINYKLVVEDYVWFLTENMDFALKKDVLNLMISYLVNARFN